MNCHTNCDFFGQVFAQKGSLVAVPLGEMKFGKLRKSELEINHFFRQFDYFDEFCCNLGKFWVIFAAYFWFKMYKILIKKPRIG